MRPFRGSLNRADRHRLVRQSAEKVAGHQGPESLRAGRRRQALALVPRRLARPARRVVHEGVLHRRASSVLAWDHIAPLGRDQWVRVVYPGYLFPFGHACALVKITERRFTANPALASLYQIKFLVVSEPSRTYSASGNLHPPGLLPDDHRRSSPARRRRSTPSSCRTSPFRPPLGTRLPFRVHRRLVGQGQPPRELPHAAVLGRRALPGVRRRAERLRRSPHRSSRCRVRRWRTRPAPPTATRSPRRSPCAGAAARRRLVDPVPELGRRRRRCRPATVERARHDHHLQPDVPHRRPRQRREHRTGVAAKVPARRRPRCERTRPIRSTDVEAAHDRVRERRTRAPTVPAVS